MSVKSKELLGTLSIFLLEEKLLKLQEAMQKAVDTYVTTINVDGHDILFTYTRRIQVLQATIKTLDVDIAIHGDNLQSIIKTLTGLLSKCKRRPAYIYAIDIKNLTGDWITPTQLRIIMNAHKRQANLIPE